MRHTIRNSDAGYGGRRFAPGIRLKLIGFLLPPVILLVASLAAAVMKITDSAIRQDLLHRGVAISRVIAFTAGYSLLSDDRLALDSLTAEARDSIYDVEFVAIRDMGNTVLAHSRVDERGKKMETPERSTPLGTFLETEAAEVSRSGRSLIEFTTPIFFSGKRVGTVSVALSKGSLVTAQREVERSILVAASALLALALLGTLLLASLVTTPVKKLSSGVRELAGGETFHPIPVRGQDEVSELTRNFNRMAETILAQQNRLSRYARELEDAYVGMVRVIAASIDARDPYTMGHSNRVARISCKLGERLGFSMEELEHLEKACIFHDVGKIRTPDNILLKTHSLSNPEYEEMRSHPLDGADILQMAPSLHRYIPVVLAHHEWYDGNGYPDGKRGSEIPVHAQIIALVDAFDAMTTTRPYRKALTREEAIEEILRYRGTQFSPMLTDAFVQMIKELPVMDNDDWKGMAL